MSKNGSKCNTFTQCVKLKLKVCISITSWLFDLNSTVMVNRGKSMRYLYHQFRYGQQRQPPRATSWKAWHSLSAQNKTIRRKGQSVGGRQRAARPQLDIVFSHVVHTHCVAVHHTHTHTQNLLHNAPCRLINGWLTLLRNSDLVS